MLPLLTPPRRVQGCEGHFEARLAEKISRGNSKGTLCPVSVAQPSGGGTRDLLEVSSKCELIRLNQRICHPPTPPM